MYITREVLVKVKDTIGCLKPECGGIIAINQDGVISDYFFDDDAGFGKASYVPSRLSIQNHIRNNWNSTKLQFCGIVHSHPLCNTCEPSYIDINMAVKIMTANYMKIIYLLMVKGDEIRLFYVRTENSHEQHSFKEEIIELYD